MFPIRGNSFCGYHCVGAIDALLQDPHALDSSFECSYDVLAVTRKRILDAFSEWWAVKRLFYTSDAEMEEKDVAPHVESSESFRVRVSGKKEGGLLACPCDLALYVLKTDILIVLLDVQRVKPSTSNEWDEAKAFDSRGKEEASGVHRHGQRALRAGCSAHTCNEVHFRSRRRLGRSTPPASCVC